MGHPSDFNIELPSELLIDHQFVKGEGQREAFLQALRYLQNRIALFLALPISSLDDMAMRRKLKGIGQSEGASAKAEASE